MIYEMIEVFFRARVDEFRGNLSQRALQWNFRFQQLWSLNIYPIFELLVSPMFDDLLNAIQRSLNSKNGRITPIMVVLLVVSVFFEIIAIIGIRASAVHLRRVLRLCFGCCCRGFNNH